MMKITKLQHKGQLAMRVMAATYVISVFLSGSLHAAPGAHGPNGEHIEIKQSLQGSSNPKFESFTESFELLGELYPDTLRIYLHDFETNRAVANADIELETGDLSVPAQYDATGNYYVASDSQLMAQLSVPGEHQVVLTVLTEDAGDLLAASLITPESIAAPTVEAHHHDMPWWSIAMGLGALAVGFVLGRIKWRAAA